MRWLQLRARRGSALIWAIVIALIVAALAFLAIRGARLASLIDVESVTIDGPSRVALGSSATYTVTVVLEDSVESTTLVQVQIFEDDFGPDELLDNNVSLTFLTGSGTATGTFTLTCNLLEEPGPDDEALVGDGGEDEDETGSTFEIYGFVLRDNIVEGGSGATFNVTCFTPVEEQ